MTKKADLFSRLIMEGCQFYEQIGSSPLGTLYSVTHPEYGNCVLKHFSEALSKKSAFLKGTLQPLEKLQQFEHPNLCKVHCWESGKQGFMFRELVVGASLRQYLKIRDKVDIVKATQAVTDVAMGLLAGYPFGIVYKNLKPSNIILLPDGTACLVDFSLPPSDPHYIAPELWDGEKSDARADIYALGIIYYEVLTGLPPFRAETRKQLKELHLTRTPSWSMLPANTPESIEKIIEKMLRKDRERRYRSALPLIGELREALKNMGAQVKSVPSSFMRPKTGEFKAVEKKDVVPDDKEYQGERRNYTAMLVAQDVKEALPDDPVAGEAFLQEPLVKQEDEIEVAIEEVYLSKEDFTQSLKKALLKITYIKKREERKGALPSRVVYFPKEYEQEVIAHLQKSFRRETWLLKDSETLGEMEVEIDLEQAHVLQHFYHFEDLLQNALKEETIVEEQQETINLATEDIVCIEENEQAGDTIDLAEEDVVCVESGDQTTGQETIDLNENDIVCFEEENEGVETINDITLSSCSSYGKNSKEKSEGKKIRFRNPDLTVAVDFENAYQTMGWVKFVRKYDLKKGEHFDIKEDSIEWAGVREFVIHLDKLEHCQQEQENISRIKEFFQADYEIVELDRGGMGAVLKLTAKNDPTFLSLRPENYWARERFSEYLQVMKDRKGKEIVYAEIPKGMEFVVKVAFEGYEESLIQEAQLLSKIAEDPHVCQTVIGAVQQGRLFALNEKSDQTRIGYYIMLEYAQQGNAEKLYQRFPEKRVTPSIAFAIMYGMAQTLVKLDQLGTIHRDIKPQNILLDKNGVPKLSDFGLAILTNEETGKMTEERKRLLRIMDEEFLRISRSIEKTENDLSELKEKRNRVAEGQDVHEIDFEIADIQTELERLKVQEQERVKALKGKYRLISAQENATKGKFAGSPHYAAPEQLTPGAVLTPKCDIYQLGAVMFTLLTGRRPVEGKTTFDVMSHLLYCEKPKVSDYVKDDPLVDALGSLIYQMMAHEPEARIDIHMVRETMGQISFEHALRLKEPPVFKQPKSIDSKAQLEKWNSKVAFALDLHQKCVHSIFSTLFQNRQQPGLRSELDKIVFTCNGCGKKLHVYRHMQGKKGNCPKCGKRILIQLGEEG